MARRALSGPISMVLGYALFASTGQAAPLATADDGFGITDLPAGYELARMHGEGEGKCGEGKCGGDDGAKGKAEAEGKCGEGKCGADSEKGGAEGKCGADGGKENAEGQCGGSH
ncbi:MAG: hypothetical protein R3F35_10620 [Myxococcota bacterium]